MHPKSMAQEQGDWQCVGACELSGASSLPRLDQRMALDHLAGASRAAIGAGCYQRGFSSTFPLALLVTLQRGRNSSLQLAEEETEPYCGQPLAPAHEATE